MANTKHAETIMAIHQPNNKPVKPVKTEDMSKQEYDEAMAEYVAEMKEWEADQKEAAAMAAVDGGTTGPAFDEKLKGAHPEHGHVDDVQHGPAFGGTFVNEGPGVSNWVNPDSITGPGVQ